MPNHSDLFSFPESAALDMLRQHQQQEYEASKLDLLTTIERSSEEIKSIVSKPDFTPRICLDFDGVIHKYSKGWNGGSIYDDPVDGSQDFCRDALNSFKVAIFSTRSKDEEGRLQIQKWLDKWNFPSGIELPIDKPMATVYIDDRGLTFNGTFPDIETLKNFKTWQGQ